MLFLKIFSVNIAVSSLLLVFIHLNCFLFYEIESTHYFRQDAY